MCRFLETRLDEVDASNPYWAEMDLPERKRFVQSLVGRVIDLIRGQGRDPDEWESAHLSVAIRCIELCAFRVGRMVATRAMMPMVLRTPLAAAFDERDLTNAELAKRLDTARGRVALRLPG